MRPDRSLSQIRCPDSGLAWGGWWESIVPGGSALVVQQHLAASRSPTQLSVMANPAFDYRSLSVADRLQLVGDIWDSIAEEASATPDALPLTLDQKAELERRLAAYDADPTTGVTMEEAFERIRARFQKPK